MNVKQTESEAKLCELTARLEDLSNKESSIAVSISPSRSYSTFFARIQPLI